MTSTPLVDIALDRQLGLINFWKGEYGRRYGAAYGKSMGVVGGPTVEEAERVMDLTEILEDRNMADVVGKPLDISRTYAVTHDIVIMLEAAGQRLPRDAMLLDNFRGQVPCPAGFIHLASPITCIARNGLTLRCHALQWLTLQTVLKDQDGTHGPVVNMIWLAAYGNINDPLDEEIERLRADVGGDEYLRMLHQTTPLSLFHWAPASYLNTEEDAELETHEKNILGKWLVSFFRFTSQTITVVTKSRPSRAAARRRFRVDPTQTGDVHVVDLRRKHYIEADPLPWDHPKGEIAWSRRWIVHAHWRTYHLGHDSPNCQCSVRNPEPHVEHRWIEDFVKGPEDRPLIVTDMVNRVKR